MEQTFAFIKPDAVAARNTGAIISLIEKNGFSIVAMQKMTLDKKTARQFYDVHKNKTFFTELVDFISSGPVVALILEKHNAVIQWRKLMGHTNPTQAAEETIRKLYGSSISSNATHGSDGLDSAKNEIELIFPDLTKK